MRLLGTFIIGGSAFAVYTAKRMTKKQISRFVDSFADAETVWFNDDFRLLSVGSEYPPPTVLEPDLSESVWDKKGEPDGD